MARLEDLENAGFRVAYDDNGEVADIVTQKGLHAGIGNIFALPGTPTSMVKLTQAEYNALTPDANTLYVIVG